MDLAADVNRAIGLAWWAGCHGWMERVRGLCRRRLPRRRSGTWPARPKKVTRATDLPTNEPPAWAATAPNSARKSSELPDTAQTNADRGTRRTSRSGRAAPTVKLARRREGGLHGPRAQCVGDAEFIAGVGAECILGHQLRGHLFGEVGIESARDIDSGQFGVFVVAIRS